MEYIDLKRFRYENGRMTQAELAVQLGVTQAQIAYIESGKRSMSNELLDSLRQKYNNIDCYITDSDDEKRERVKDNNTNEVLILRAKVEQMQDEIQWLRGMIERLTAR